MKIFRFTPLFLSLFITAFSTATIAEEKKQTEADTKEQSIDSTEINDGNDIVIASGHPFGVRYALGGVICQFVNNANNEKSCTTYPTNNSGEGLNAIDAGKADFAIVQSDWLTHAKDGTSRFNSAGKNDQLRSVAVIGGENVVIVASKDSGIKTVSDLKNKSIDVGVDNTYRSIVAQEILDSAGLDLGDLKIAGRNNQEDAIDGVCKGVFDGAVFVLPHPNSVLDMMTGQCNISFISMSASEVKAVEKSLKGFYISTIPADTYWGQDNPVTTVGLYTVVVTKQDTPLETVNIVRGEILKKYF